MALLRRENVCMKGRTLWATRRTDEKGRGLISPPVEVPFWNNPAQYFGHGKKYKFGNILQRQIMQVANILILNSLNPDTYCQQIAGSYQHKNYTLGEVIAIGSYTLEDMELDASNEQNPLMRD